MTDTVKTIKTETAIEAEITLCLSDFKQNRKKHVDCCLSYETVKSKNELEDWEHEQWEKLINSAAEKIQDSAYVLAILKNCYPQIFAKVVGDKYAAFLAA